jgi:Cullin family
LLDYDKDEDLQRMYALLARIPEGLEPLRKKFEEHVKQAGLVAVSKLVGEGGAAVDTLVGNTMSYIVYIVLTCRPSRTRRLTWTHCSRFTRRTKRQSTGVLRAKQALSPALTR